MAILKKPWFASFATCVLVVLGAVAKLEAHDGHEPGAPITPAEAANLRTWTHISGLYQVQGSFVRTRLDQIQIRKVDGDLLEIKKQALSEADRDWVDRRLAEIERVNHDGRIRLISQRQEVVKRSPDPKAGPDILASFKPFADKLNFRWDQDYLYVESNGMPDHPLMVGIASWQQQVPLPQRYVGENAWRIPLEPVVAKRQLSARNRFLRGAIALASNGVPIFNPLNNRGDDAYLAGELDLYGGHCGRADDYHYHLPPVHLEKTIGKGLPIAFALDGYPIYGYEEPDGSMVRGLDAFNGHEGSQKKYHYHSTRTYPYLNGGFHGEVVERDGQVDPQPRAEPIREGQEPLRGAKITGFERLPLNKFRLKYDLEGQTHQVNYSVGQNGTVTFQFVDDQGRTTTETYRGRGDAARPPARLDRRRGGAGPDRPRPPRPDGNPPPRSPLLSAIDQNSNGELSPSEILNASITIRALDKDRNGTISREELRTVPPGEENRPGRPRDRAEGNDPQENERPEPDADRPPRPEMSALDVDGNGELSATEIAQAARSLLRLDRDRDRGLSDRELRPEPPGNDPPPARKARAERRPPAPSALEKNLLDADFGGMTVTSPAFPPGGKLPAEYTCDGAAVSPPIAWKDAPVGTGAYALSLWHVPPDGGIKSYWVVYDIPAETSRLERRSRGVGQDGLNDKRAFGYDPMCSRGPGLKTYHLTVFALAKPLDLDPKRTGRAEMLRAIKDVVLAQKTLTFTYERPGE